MHEKSGGPGDETDQLVTALLAASRALVGVSARSLQHVEDTVTVPQFRALVVLSNRGPVNLAGLAAALDVVPSSAQRMVDRLVAAELVSRQENPASRREVLLQLTAAGRRLVRRVTQRRRADITRIVLATPAAERQRLVRALRAFADAAGEPDPDELARLGW